MFIGEVSELVNWVGTAECVPLGRFVEVYLYARLHKQAKHREEESRETRKETRAVISLWPWLRFHWACGVSWPRLDLIQKRLPIQTGYALRLDTNVHHIISKNPRSPLLFAFNCNSWWSQLQKEHLLAILSIVTLFFVPFFTHKILRKLHSFVITGLN